jgi:hypothetical protein
MTRGRPKRQGEIPRLRGNSTEGTGFNFACELCLSAYTLAGSAGRGVMGRSQKDWAAREAEGSALTKIKNQFNRWAFLAAFVVYFLLAIFGPIFAGRF